MDFIKAWARLLSKHDKKYNVDNDNDHIRFLRQKQLLNATPITEVDSRFGYTPRRLTLNDIHSIQFIYKNLTGKIY